MKLYYLFFFTFFIAISSPILNAQSYSVSSVIESAINNLSFEMLDSEFESKEDYGDFNFMSFKPVKTDSLSDYYFSCYYNMGEIKKISIIDDHDKRMNYNFGVLHTDSLIYMIATKSDSVNREDVSNVYGFFIIEKITKHIYFFGPVYYEYDLDATISSTRNILILNKHLVAKKKLIFLNRKLIYQTSYDYSNRKVNEDLWHYMFHPNIPDKGCGKYKDISKLTLSDLYKLFVKISHCPCNKLDKLEPKEEYVGSHIPFVWDVNEYFHK